MWRLHLMSMSVTRRRAPESLVDLTRLPETRDTRHWAQVSDPMASSWVKDDVPWITDDGLNAIVRVDPETLAIDIFPLPVARPTQISTRPHSITTTICGSPVRTVSTAGWTHAPEIWRSSTLPEVAGPMELPRALIVMSTMHLSWEAMLDA